MSHGYTVEDNLKLVMKIAHRYNNRIETTLEDIYQEGCIGLMRAVKEYDDSKGVSFSAFAGQYITFYILNHLTTVDTIKKSRYIIENANKIIKSGLKEESVEVICKELCISKKSAVAALQHLSEYFVSSEMPVSQKNGKELTIAEILPDEDDQFEEVLNRYVIESDCFEVSEEEKTIIKYLYEGYTTQEIAEIMGIANFKSLYERIKRIKNKFKNKRHLMYI